MKYYVDYPLSVDTDGGAWLDPANMTRFAQAAEAAGVDAIALTDHPAPSRKWRNAGGHDTLDPFVGLTHFAAVTTKLRVMTYLTVVGYRNPFLLAKNMTSVDVVSGGRAQFVVGTGYLRSEFAALGADFENRNEIFDEAMEVVRGMLSSPHEFHHEGKHYRGLGVTMSPPPVQRPYPPIWIGGNAKIVRKRVAQWADAWAPMTVGGAMLSKTSRTAGIMSDAQLAEQIRELKDDAAAFGRDPSTIDIAIQGTTPPKADASAAEKLDYLGTLADMGGTWTPVSIDKVTVAQSIDDLARYGDEVIAHLR